MTISVVKDVYLHATFCVLHTCVCVCVCVCVRLLTHRKQNDGDGECDGGQYSQTHTQDQSVIRVDLAVGV